MPIRTQAWVIRPNPNPREPKPAKLELADIEIPDVGPQEVLVETLTGCWEGNMSHALDRKPVDICVERGEPFCVVGNAGVVRVLEPGSAVKNFKPGDLAIVFCNGEEDEYGYPKKIFAYDAKNTYGCLAKRTKLKERQLILIPKNTKHSLAAWAAFSLRYITAWSNWEVASGVLRLQIPKEQLPKPHVWGWGGGVSLAELALAKFHGCETVMISSQQRRLDLIRKMGIDGIDRRDFPGLSFDQELFKTDKDYRMEYLAAEEKFLALVKEKTGGQGVNIFIDYVGSPVLRVTLKALARQGVITTAGWKEGMMLWIVRAIECINRHQHIHTHYARYDQGVQAVEFAEKNGWVPIPDDRIYTFEEIPLLAEDYAAGNLTCFPTFTVNRT